MLRARVGKQKEVTMKSSVIALGLIVAVAAQAAPPTFEEVGDPDSFGRDVIYLGNAQTANVALQEDCTPDPSAPPLPNDRCVTLAAQPAATSWNEDGLATLQLPADSTKSLICFALTPNVNYEYNNLTGVAQPNARFTARAVITIENEVLDDPTLIDPNTGLPYGGKMTLPLSTWSESRSIAAGEREQKSMFLSRHCIGGLVSKRSLVGSGLTETQAKQFFKKPMKFTFGSTGTVQIVDFANYFYGIRLYGDSKDNK
jgi:hypothetical protein